MEFTSSAIPGAGIGESDVVTDDATNDLLHAITSFRWRDMCRARTETAASAGKSVGVREGSWRR
ncbi:hypothetical protein ACWDA9_19925 [Streptomyces sp. NPDC001193]